VVLEPGDDGFHYGPILGGRLGAVHVEVLVGILHLERWVLWAGSLLPLPHLSDLCAKMTSTSSTKNSQRSFQCHPKRSTNKQKKGERLLSFLPSPTERNDTAITPSKSSLLLFSADDQNDITRASHPRRSGP
jgi:hypothetical protein